MYIKLKDWAKRNGVTYQTAWNWVKAEKFPVAVKRTATGTILVLDETVTNLKEMKDSINTVAIYARVSSSDQKDDLNRQVARLTEYATKVLNLQIIDVVMEVGSGLNGSRPKFIKLLNNKNIPTILTEHRDRVCRFGFEYLEAALSAQNRRIIVQNTQEVQSDLASDMTEILTSFCARLYGSRSANRKAKKAIEALG